MSDSETTFCNARLRQNGHDPEDRPKVEPSDEWAGDGYCKRRTETPRCRMHGGGNTSEGRPVKHGLYSSKRDALREKLEQAKGQDAPGDLWTEVAVLRALLSDFLEDLETVDTEAIDGATKLQKEIRRTVDTIHQQMHRDAPSEEEIQRLITSFANILQTYVPEDDRSDALDELESVVGSGRRAALESGR